MKLPVSLRSLIAVVLGGAQAASFAAVSVDEQVVAPSGQDVKYVVSNRGVHVAAITRKGSRQVVVIDGAAGPRIDAIVTPTFGWIDPRPYQAASANRGAGRHQVDEQSAQAVTFSKDGSRSAYVAKTGQDWAVIVDQKEMLRLPGAATTPSNDVRLEFTGPTGKHLLFARAVFDGFELWVDGQKWPGFFGSGGGGTDGTIDPVISPDGEHVAYVAQMSREKQALIIDGKEAPYFAKRLLYSPDSHHLVGIADSAKGQSLLLDGKALFTASSIHSVALSPDGRRVAAVVSREYPDHTYGQALIIDGKPVEATFCKNGLKDVIFSPDSKHYAAVCSESPNAFYVVTDGKKQQGYDFIGNPTAVDHGIAFSPDSTQLAYVARGAGKSFLIVNGEESDEAFDSISGFRFSADGTRLAYCGSQTGQAKSPWVIDGKTLRLDRAADIDQFDFSPDGSHYAFIGYGNYGGPIYVDGKIDPIVATRFAFSPDGKHLAIAGYNPADNARGLWVDGTSVYTGERTPEFVTFSADSQHIYWTAQEAATGPDAQPGAWDVVTYADGLPAARCDHGSVRTLMMPMGYAAYTTHPGWQPTGPSGLSFVGTVGDSVKQFVLTPTDSSVATMLGGKARAAEAPGATPKKATPATPATPASSTAPHLPATPAIPATPGQVQSAVTAAGAVANDPKAAAVDAATRKAKEKADALAKKAKSWLDGVGNKSK